MFPVTALALLVLSGGVGLFSRGRDPGRGNRAQNSYYGSSFRYIIAYNDLALDGTSRDITVVMDPSEFSEINLRTLFRLLRNRFKGVPAFTAYVETSLQDVPTPEERDGPHISEEPTNPKAFRNPSAMIKHSSNADSLYIYSPSRREAKYPPAKIDLRDP